MIAIVLLGCFMAAATAMALFALWLALRPPVEGHVGTWVHISTGREYEVEILPGGFDVRLTNSDGTMLASRDYFCRAFDRVRT